VSSKQKAPPGCKKEFPVKQLNTNLKIKYQSIWKNIDFRKKMDTVPKM